jgi:hypothetical protein
MVINCLYLSPTIAVDVVAFVLYVLIACEQVTNNTESRVSELTIHPLMLMMESQDMTKLWSVVSLCLISKIQCYDDKQLNHLVY